MIRRLVPTLALALAACGGGENGDDIAALEAGHARLVSDRGVAIEVDAREPLRTGANVLHVRLASGEASLVSATGLMPSHGHGTRPAAIEQVDDGYVVRDLVFYMAGRWEVRLVLSNDDEGLFLVDVP